MQVISKLSVYTSSVFVQPVFWEPKIEPFGVMVAGEYQLDALHVAQQC